jgi:predicted nucleic acid-binding protein
MMLLLDANVFLRALTVTDDPELERVRGIASRLFREIEAGNVEAMVSDAVLAEVAFILTARSQYGLPVEDAAGMLKALVELRGLRVSDRQTLLHALALWAERPKLGFVDALTATQAQRLDVELVSFDSDFDGFAGIRRWLPSA